MTVPSLVASSGTSANKSGPSAIQLLNGETRRGWFQHRARHYSAAVQMYVEILEVCFN